MGTQETKSVNIGYLIVVFRCRCQTKKKKRLFIYLFEPQENERGYTVFCENVLAYNRKQCIYQMFCYQIIIIIFAIIITLKAYFKMFPKAENLQAIFAMSKAGEKYSWAKVFID